jgi:hypothetical protein
MEDVLDNGMVDSVEATLRRGASAAANIVYVDPRSAALEGRIFYKNLHKFRVAQMNDGVNLSLLTDEQWGLKQLDKCHHISTTSTSKDGPQSFRVRICKTCCQEDSHIELGALNCPCSIMQFIFLTFFCYSNALYRRHLR